MDAREVKSALKSAREAIRNKDYKDALKHCKTILKSDKNNYNALVFIGVAAEGLEQNEQALVAYKKATEISPEQLLGWQGLAGFYEKADKPEHNADLVEVYTKMAELLKTDKDKWFDMTQKLVQVHMQMKNAPAAVVQLERLISGDVGEAKTVNLWTQLVALLESTPELSDEHQDLLMRGYHQILLNPKEGVDVKSTTEKYIKRLMKKELSTGGDPLPEIRSLSERFPDDSYPLEILCQAQLDTTLCDASIAKLLSQAMCSLTKLDQSSQLGKLCAGYLKLIDGNLNDVRAPIIEACTGLPLLSATVVLAELHLKLHDRNAVQRFVQKVASELKSENCVFFGAKKLLKSKCDLLLSYSYIEGSSKASYEKAVTLCKEIISTDFKILHQSAKICLCYAYLLLNKNDDLKEVMITVQEGGEEAFALQGWVNFIDEDYPAAQSKLEKALALAENNGHYLYMMARVYSELAKTNEDFADKCFNTLLRAAKADPNYSPTFLHLGKYYETTVKDISKARRCYQKAYQLDSENDDVGATFADALKQVGEEDTMFSILKAVTSKAKPGEAKWAWLRLGLHQLKHDDPSVAITSLQSALRADITDRHCWECLGEAYMKRGSYTAALKAFTRTTELDPDALYCFYQIAYIKQLLGEFPDALKAYEGILEQTPGYVPALKGAGETNVLLAGEYLEEFFHGRAVGHCEAAITQLTRASASRPDLSSLWKLLGNACTLLHSVPADVVHIKVPSKLLSQAKTGDETTSLGKNDILALGSRCYGMAVKQQADCSSLWHDLGLSYYYQAKHCDKSKVKVVLGKSIQAVQKALSLDTSNHRHWNALGVIVTSDDIDHPGLAQHAFIKSIQCESNNVVAWTNIGTLYLINQQIELAHEAFKVAQSLEPSYVAAWVGQALIAETVGHDDAMDLFRHTTELGMHVESATGYAHWVCSTLLDTEKMSSNIYKYAIEQMSAVPAASDALAKFTERVKTDPIAFNLYGLLLERQGLNSMATKAFESALRIMEKGGTDLEVNSVRENYARMLSKTGEYQEAATQYGALNASENFDLCVGLAIAQFKSGSTAESYASYEKALLLAEDEEQRSHVYAAMGMLAYSVDDFEGAKSALFNCSQMSPPSAPGLTALMSLGLLQSDATLAAAVHQEIVKLDLNDKYRSHLEKLTACIQNLQVKGQLGYTVASLAKAVHNTPGNCEMWRALSRQLVCRGGKYTSATTCAQAARLVQSGYRPTQIQNSMETLSMLANGFHSPSYGARNAFSAAQRAVLMFPDELSSWCTLLSAAQAQYQVAPEKKRTGLAGLIISLAAHIMAKVEAELTGMSGDKSRTQALHLWSVKQYVIALLQKGRKEHAHKFLQSAIWLYEEDTDLQALAAALDQNVAALKGVCEKDGSGFAWQLLASLYVSRGLIKEVESSYQAWVREARGDDQKLMACTALCFHIYQQIINGGNVSTKLFHETVDQALSLCPSCVPVLLMQGLVYMKEKNARFTRINFQRIVQNKSETLQTQALTMARQQLLGIYLNKNDDESVQSLLQDAKNSGDEEFLLFHQSKTSAKY